MYYGNVSDLMLSSLCRVLYRARTQADFVTLILTVLIRRASTPLCPRCGGEEEQEEDPYGIRCDHGDTFSMQ
jgi:hypothetical protein